MENNDLHIKKKLFEILENVDQKQIFGAEKVVSRICIDSRKVAQNSLFCALKGSQIDGHRFIDSAIKNGADSIVCSTLPDTIAEEVTYVLVDDVRSALEGILHEFFEDVSSQISLIGITGTNGKTTVATLLFDLFRDLGYKVGLVSTVENRICEDVIPTALTTPDIVELHELLYKMSSRECEYVFMEVSSHAIDQRRIGDLKFDIGVFTNISHDHLDYHKTFKNYINTKKKFFDELSKTSYALTNIDDANGEVMLQNTKAKKKSYSVFKMADFKAKIIASDIRGTELDLNKQRIFTHLIGSYNAYNLSAVYGVATLLGVENERILIGISGLKAPKGRFEIVSSPNQATVIVDYAHTPDALLKILKAIGDVRYQGQIITVIGCGGDRDSAKRPKMAQVAVSESDQVILTSDNPRSEDPQDILGDMLNGLSTDELNKVVEIVDRKNAIKMAIKLASNEDIVLIAGKGHEDYQEIKGVKYPFDDAKIAREFLA